MPRAKRVGERTVLYAEIPIDLRDWLKARAERNLRSMVQELRFILEAARTAEAQSGSKPS